MSARCRWCGRFTPSAMEPTTRTVRGADDEWRTVRQTLCADCGAVWSIEAAWNRAADYGLPLVVR